LTCFSSTPNCPQSPFLPSIVIFPIIPSFSFPSFYHHSCSHHSTIVLIPIILPSFWFPSFYHRSCSPHSTILLIPIILPSFLFPSFYHCSCSHHSSIVFVPIILPSISLSLAILSLSLTLPKFGWDVSHPLNQKKKPSQTLNLPRKSHLGTSACHPSLGKRPSHQPYNKPPPLTLKKKKSIECLCLLPSTTPNWLGKRFYHV
jgi:hypothetical protein